MSQNINFEHVVKIVNEFSTIGESRGLGKLYTEDLTLDGRSILIKEKPLINLGSCSYLGLELDVRLKEAAIDAIKKYGALFSCSRIYVSSGNYKELEELSAQIFNAHILLTTTVSIGHYCVMPIIIGSKDMVIFDQQAHISMQEQSYKLSHYGTGITILRHNRLDELEEKIELYKSKYDKIWYVIDGVYSMFGDLAPIKDIIRLLDKHKKLHLYVDDAHGVSWAGKNGAGYVFSQTELHPKMVMGTSMAKGFGSCGGVFLFKDKELRDKVRKWGGPLAYSGPQEPATIGAAIASAKIHLSDDIYKLQNDLQTKIKFCNEMMAQYKVPLVSESSSPIFFVGCGLPRVGFNLIERLIGEGFYTNIGIFPAVPETCTGVRFTLTNHITHHDIENLAKAFAYHHPLALKDEDRSMKDIYKAFRKFTNFEERFGPVENFATLNIHEKKETKNLILKTYKSIREISKEMWNDLLGDRGAFDFDNLLLLEDVFCNNEDKENNWNFFYYIVYNSDNTPLLATFFTSTFSKDDMLSSEKISMKIEEKRKTDTYYLTSKCFLMGSPLTNGDHLYIKREDPQWQEATIKMLDAVWQDFENEKANSLFLRDFDAFDDELSLFFIHQGFVKTDNLENNILSPVNNMNFDEYFNSTLNSRQRKIIKKEVLSNLSSFNFTVNNINEDELLEIYNLYQNVKNKTMALNTFKLPYKFFKAVNISPYWEILKIEFDSKIIGAILSYKGCNSYCPVVLGMDYEYVEKYNLYKKILYFSIKRGFDLKLNTLHFGITASETKHKYGIKQFKQVAFIQLKDHYNQDLIDSMSFESQ